MLLADQAEPSDAMVWFNDVDDVIVDYCPEFG